MNYRGATAAFNPSGGGAAVTTTCFYHGGAFMHPVQALLKRAELHHLFGVDGSKVN